MQVEGLEIYTGSGNDLVVKSPSVGTLCEQIVKIRDTFYWNDGGVIKTTYDVKSIPGNTYGFYAYVNPDKSADTESRPDFCSHKYNYRKEKFQPRFYPYNKIKGEQWAAFAISPGTLDNTNRQVELTGDNKLVIQLFDKYHEEGFHVDSVGALYGSWLRSLKPNQYREDAIKCNTVGLIALDNSAQKTHGYADSPEEMACPPDKKFLMPSLEEWIDIWKRARSDA